MTLLPNEPLMSRSRSAVSLPCALLALLACARGTVAAQQGNTGPLTREAAVGMALARGSQAALASVTARGVEAQLLSARAIPNPTLVASYSKSTPQYHAALEIPLDYLTLRPLRIASALSAADAARYRLAFERAAIRLDVDTLYTRASAQRARAALSKRNATDADSLLVVARVRRDAGDASELDVELARVNAGQAENAAASDSLAAIATVLDLQATLGLPATDITIALADSLAVPSIDSLARLASAPLPPLAGTPLSVAAAERDLRAAELALSLERRSMWTGLALSAGFETHDPTGSETGVLPTVGISLPLPFFNQRQGEVALATVNRDRARAELERARRESAALIARSRRSLVAAAARVARDRDLVASANRVAALSLRAYAEGAYPLVNVLEAQRNAREALAQLIDDTAAANGAASAYRLFTTTALP